MRAVGKIGFRREVLILVPAMLLVLFVLAAFTLRSYRNAVAMFEEEARVEALDAARTAATLLARERGGTLWPPTPDRLETLAPGAFAVTLVDAHGAVLAVAGETPRAAPLEPLAGVAPLEAVAIGPGGKAADRVIAFAPLGRQRQRHYLRVDFDAGALARQHRNVQILAVVVIGLGIGVGALSISFARHLLAPLDTLLERARAAVPETGGMDTDEIPFLLDTFDRALAALSHDHAAEDDDIRLLGRTLTPSLDCGLLLVSPQGRILALNTLGRALLGVDEPISGEAYDDVLRPLPRGHGGARRERSPVTGRSAHRGDGARRSQDAESRHHGARAAPRVAGSARLSGALRRHHRRSAPRRAAPAVGEPRAHGRAHRRHRSRDEEQPHLPARLPVARREVRAGHGRCGRTSTRSATRPIT